MTDVEALLTRLYDAFNRQAVDEILPSMHPEVEWTNYISGGHLHGREALGVYWREQFKTILPETTPIKMETLPDGRVCVTLAYAARSVAEGGGLWLDDIMTNTYTFRDGLIVSMEWGVPVSSALPPEKVIERLFDAFNRRSATALTALLHPHVDWPDLFGAERLKGRQSVQAMWTYQFGKWDPHVSLLDITTGPDGVVHARVSYVIRQLDGRLFTEEQAIHSFEFRDGFISRMTAKAA